MNENKGNIIFYQSEDGVIRLNGYAEAIGYRNLDRGDWAERGV